MRNESDLDLSRNPNGWEYSETQDGAKVIDFGSMGKRFRKILPVLEKYDDAIWIDYEGQIITFKNPGDVNEYWELLFELIQVCARLRESKWKKLKRLVHECWEELR